MEKKDVHSMKKTHHRFILGLGLTALFGLSTPDANAGPMSLTVLLNGTPIYNVTGGNQSVSANIASLNAALGSSGYTFASLSGASNFPGTIGATGGYISDAGNVSLAATGTGGSLEIIVNQSGFTAPASGASNTLFSAETSNYSGTTTASNQTYAGNFTSGAVTETTPTLTQTSNGTAADSHATGNSVGVPTYVTSYGLTSTTVIDLHVGATSRANNVFTGKTSVVATGTVPEPASLVMMVTGMPLPLVVMGLLRRRRAAA